MARGDSGGQVFSSGLLSLFLYCHPWLDKELCRSLYVWIFTAQISLFARSRYDPDLKLVSVIFKVKVYWAATIVNDQFTGGWERSKIPEVSGVSFPEGFV